MDPRGRRFTIFAAAAASAGLAGAARAQVVAHPNQIKGTFRFTNTDPALLAILNAPGDTPPGADFGLESVDVTATSLPPQSPTLIHRTTRAAQTRLLADYEVTVESGPPGAGISYEVEGAAEIIRNRNGSYDFAGQSSAPVEEEPAADVVLDFAECAGVVRLRFVDGAGDPLVISGGTATSYPEEPLGSGNFASDPQASQNLPVASTDDLVMRGDGGQKRLVLRLRTGSDAYSDELLWEVQRIVPKLDCDRIVEEVIVLDGRGRALGSIVGQVDMLGEDEHALLNRTLIRAEGGPWGNRRLDRLDFFPSSGPYLLPDMMPSDVVSPPDSYRVNALLVFRKGNRFTQFESPAVNVLVPTGATVDLADRFVFDPGWISGDIYLQGPPIRNPALGSPLEDLYRSSAEDADLDGVPDRGIDTNGVKSSFVGAPGYDRLLPSGHGYNWSSGRTLFEGSFDPASAAFRGDYELVLGGLSRGGSEWTANDFRLYFLDKATPALPETWQDCQVQIDPNPPYTWVDPGSRVLQPLHYCVSRVNVRFRAVGGTFVNPVVSAKGAYVGLDFELRPADYEVNWTACSGTPDVAPAASEGLVVMTLPQGAFTLTPLIDASNPGGGTTRTQLNPVPLVVGCAQDIDIWTDFTLSLDSAPLCTSQPVARIAGHVAGPGDVDRLEYTVDGGPPTVLCQPCGVEPTFGFDLTLAGAITEVKVTAWDALARRAEVTARVERAIRPGDLGNTLLGLKRTPDARYDWTVFPGSRATELVREYVKTFAAPVSIATVPAPGTSEIDPDAIRAPTPLHFYRVRGLNCAGEPGP